MARPPVIAFFITPHGFGHAGRATAIMNALQAAIPGCCFVLFTTIPEVFFTQSGIAPFEYRRLNCDVGVVQRSPLAEDLEATCDRLDRMLPFDERLTTRLADQMRHFRCRLVICDIAAMGIVAASKAGIPSILIENFTWDWIYTAYAHLEPRFRGHLAYLSRVYSKANHHIQTAPLCRRAQGTAVFGPIARAPRTAPERTRRQLGLPSSAPMVLVSMGGVADTFQFLDKIPRRIGMYLVVPGADGMATKHNNVKLLPTHSSFYHPDLIAAANVIVGKAGYSTIAEAYVTGTPFGYVKRSGSPESSALERFIVKHLPSRDISEEDYASGGWIGTARSLLDQSGTTRCGENSAESVVRFLLDIMSPT